MATMEQAFEMVEKLTEELAEKEERLMKLEKENENQKISISDCDEMLFHYCIKESVYDFFKYNDGDFEKGHTEQVWCNIFNDGSDMRKYVANDDSLTEITSEFSHLRGKFRFYWGDDYDLMMEML